MKENNIGETTSDVNNSTSLASGNNPNNEIGNNTNTNQMNTVKQQPLENTNYSQTNVNLEPVVTNQAQDTIQIKNEDKELNLKEHKKNKILVLIIILLIICILFLGGFIVYKELLNKENPSSGQNDNSNQTSEPTTSTTSTTTSTSTTRPITTNKAIVAQKFNLPQTTKETTVELIDYNKLYIEYYTMSGTSENNYKNNNFNKIENNKFMWNVDGSWKVDNVIKDDIFYIDTINNEINMEYFIVTTTNKVYHVNYVETTIENGEENSLSVDNYKPINSESYKKVETKLLFTSDKTIEKIQRKGINNGTMESSIYYYFFINNKVYVASENDNKLTPVSEFLKNNKYTNSITKLYTPKTYIDIADEPYSILEDGTVNGLTDDTNNSIRVRYYLMLVYFDKNYEKYSLYHMIIDSDNLVYLVKGNNSKSNLKPIDRITYFNFEEGENYNKITANFEFNGNITFDNVV